MDVNSQLQVSDSLRSALDAPGNLCGVDAGVNLLEYALLSASLPRKPRLPMLPSLPAFKANYVTHKLSPSSWATNAKVTGPAGRWWMP